MTEHYVPEDIHSLLVRWARWCRGNFFPTSFWLEAGSLESDYLPPAGDVFQSTEEAIQKSLGTAQERFSDPEAVKIEVAVMRLPDKHRMALRLHYVAHKQLPMAQKRRMLGVTHDGYLELIHRAALMIRNCTKKAETIDRLIKL